LRLRVLRQRKYNTPQSAPEPETGGSMTYMPGTTCNYWATAQVGTCYNLDGSQSQYVTPGSVTASACASTVSAAQNGAAANLQATLGCLTSSPTAGCCTYSFQ
jgi:hypothetical protein